MGSSIWPCRATERLSRGETTDHGQTNVPSGITNAVSIAAGQYHGLALLTNGSVQSWGSYWDGATFYPVTNYPPPTSNVMAIAAGLGHDLAVLSNGTVVAWGLTNLYATTTNALAYQTNLTGVKAVACGWNHNVALLSNGLVQAWGLNAASLGWNLTNVPAGLSNAVAISAFGLHSMALLSNGTVAAWGYSPSGETNVPPGLSNVVAIAAGGLQSMALQANGTLVVWGLSTLTTVPAGLVASKTISAGFEHNLVLQSDLLTPVITEEPMDQFAPATSNVTFMVKAESLAQMTYQWQFNGTNLIGATNPALTLTDTQASNNGNYQVIVSTDAASISSSVATFTLVVAPQLSALNTEPTNYWLNTDTTFAAVVTAVDPMKYPVGYQWTLNGTNISTSSSCLLTTNFASDGNLTLTATNIAGSNSVTWNIRLALPGMVETWGDNTYGQSNRPVSLTNAACISAGSYHSLALTDGGTLQEWGEYAYGTNFYTLGSPPSGSNFVAVAASEAYDLALTSSGAVTNWGLTNDVANSVPTNLSSAQAIAAGKHHNVAILTNGTLAAWGDNTYGQLNIPADLTNGSTSVTAISAGDYFTLALRSDGTLEAFGDNTYGQTNIPAAATNNIVSVAAGGGHCLALNAAGNVIAWGLNTSHQTNVPTNLSNVIAVAAGEAHSVVLLNDSVSLYAWGDNSQNQSLVPFRPSTVTSNVTPATNSIPAMTNFTTNYVPPVMVKSIAAGGNHTMAAIWSPLVEYPIDVSKDLLLIYNTSSPGNGSSNVCAYYLANRPMVANCTNVLAISCTPNEQIDLPDYTNDIQQPIQNWLSSNPTKRPSYVILFQDIPSRTYLVVGTNLLTEPSVRVLINTTYAANWQPLVSSINMNGVGGTNDCIAYINKLALFGSNYSPGQLVLSASAGGYGGTNYYGDTNWYFDDGSIDGLGPFFYSTIAAVTNVITNASITYLDITTGPDAGVLAGHITNALNIAGFASFGVHGYFGYTNGGYPTNGTIEFTGQSGWYLLETGESFNGERDGNGFQGYFLEWFASNAFAGTNSSNYTNTPVGAVSNVEEPQLQGINTPTLYFGEWAAGRIFAYCAWNSFTIENRRYSQYLQVVGDPFTRK